MKSDKKESRSGALTGSDTNELPNAQSQIKLPERTQEFMQSGAAEGSRNEETFFAAQQMRDADFSEQAAAVQLVPQAKASGISEIEALRAIQSAYSRRPRAPIGRGTQYSSGQRVRRTPKFKKVEIEPEALPDSIERGDTALIKAAFEPGEFICISDTFEAEDGRHLPHDGNTYTREELLEWLKEKPINKIWSDRHGLFIRINPMLDGGNSDDDVAAFRHVLVECDEGTHEAQLGAIRKLGLSITAIIHSRGKSVHAWIRVDAKSESEYSERVAHIFAYCEQALGMKLDPKNRNPSRYSRMADVQRALEIKEDERGIPRVLKWGQQRLLEVNVPGKSWDEWREWVARMDAAAPKPIPEFDALDDLEEEDLPELKIIIEDILNQGAKMTVGGSSKAGKTWLLMHLAFSIATGRPWLGLNTYKGRILYVNFELQKQYFKKRWQSIKRAMGIPQDEKVPDLVTWTLRGHFMTAELFKEAILEKIGDQKFDAIFIDPLYKLLNGAHANAAGDMQKILAELEQIAERAGAALVYADHFSKGNQADKNPMDRISGSGVTARDPDAILTFTDHEEPGCLTLEFVLRNFKPVDPVVVQKQEGGFLFDRREDLDPGDLRRPGSQQKYNEQQLLDQLPADGTGVEASAWRKAVEKATGMGQKKFEKLRTLLKDRDLVCRNVIMNQHIWSRTKTEDLKRTADPSEDDPFA